MQRSVRPHDISKNVTNESTIEVLQVLDDIWCIPFPIPLFPPVTNIRFIGVDDDMANVVVVVDMFDRRRKHTANIKYIRL